MSRPEESQQTGRTETKTIPGPAGSSLGGRTVSGTSTPTAFLTLLVLANAAAWTYLGGLYAASSAIPLEPGPLLLRVGFWTLTHCLVGRALCGSLAGREGVGMRCWGFWLLAGQAAVPCLLWTGDRLGARTLGWWALAGLAGAGLARLGSEAFRLSTRGAEGSRPPLARLAAAVSLPVAISLSLAVAALLRQDDIVYLKRAATGAESYSFLDNLSHAAFAAEFGRQEPYRHFWLAFIPDRQGLWYHSLTDVQLWAWAAVPPGDILDVVHRERFLLQGFALLTGVYLLVKGLSRSTRAALLVTSVLAAFPYPSLGLIGGAASDGLQYLWLSFTAQNGAALAAGFLASVWGWSQRGEMRLRVAALVLGVGTLFAKVPFALLAWPVAGAWILLRRPRGGGLWLAALCGLGALLQASQPRGPDIGSIPLEWAPGRFWTTTNVANAEASTSPGLRALDPQRLTPTSPASKVGMVLAKSGAGLLILALGTAVALLARGAPRTWPVGGWAIAIWVALSWAVFLGFVSSFWYANSAETGKQFLSWLALVCLVAGSVGCRELFRGHSGGSSRAIAATLCVAGIALWSLALWRAYEQTLGWQRTLGRNKEQPVRFSSDVWSTLRFLRSGTSATARVLSPFGPGGVAPRGPHAISGWAERRAVDEYNARLARLFPHLADRLKKRQAVINRFFSDPRPEDLRSMAAAWGVSYVVLRSGDVMRLPPCLARPVFRSGKWSVLRIELAPDGRVGRGCPPETAAVKAGSAEVSAPGVVAADRRPRP